MFGGGRPNHLGGQSSESVFGHIPVGSWCGPGVCGIANPVSAGQAKARLRFGGRFGCFAMHTAIVHHAPRVNHDARTDFRSVGSENRTLGPNMKCRRLRGRKLFCLRRSMNAALVGSLDMHRTSLIKLFPNRYRHELRFVASFVVIAAICFSLYSFPYEEGTLGHRWSEDYLVAYARMAGWVLRVFEPSIMVNEHDIVGRYAIRIVRGCDAADAQILLIAAVLATHVIPWLWRAAGVAAGIVLITLVNVMRICSLYYIGAFSPAQFDFFHHELWPLLLIALAAGIFVAWFNVVRVKAGLDRVVPEV
jgi:exosortase/archaeosortase family protein